jgi:hypothetical protein
MFHLSFFLSLLCWFVDVLVIDSPGLSLEFNYPDPLVIGAHGALSSCCGVLLPLSFFNCSSHHPLRSFCRRRRPCRDARRLWQLDRKTNGRDSAIRLFFGTHAERANELQ